MFHSWWAIDNKFEVFLFMCGIMEDPSLAIRHFCEEYATEKFSATDHFLEPYHLLQITKETRSKENFLNPFCNDQIYHVWQLPLKGESKCYIFDDSPHWLQIGDNASNTFITQETDTSTDLSDCEVYIRDTCLPPHDVLQAISTMGQQISCLHIGEPFELADESCEDIQHPIFDIDPSAFYINIEPDVYLPNAISKDLGRQLSTCYNLEMLEIPNQPIVAAEITDSLGTNRNLRILDMRDCNLSVNKMEKLCAQIGNLSNLSDCYLSGNDLGDAVSVLAESIKSRGVNNSLDTLELRHCNITPSGCSTLLEALEVCPNLEELDLSYNTICGAFNGLISKPMYPGLNNLYLQDTSLTSGDIQTIGSLMKENKMPKLDNLFLTYDNLDNLELDTLETLESLNSIIHNLRWVRFYKEGYEQQDLEKLKECIPKIILKHKSKNTK